MSDLLPANATAQERALSSAVERAGNVGVVVRDVWNPDTCPSSILPWLAWALSVDEWDTSWTEKQKRDAIKASILVHRFKGTIGAVREAIKAVGVETQVQEWFNQIPAADPYTFRLLLAAEQHSVTQSELFKLLDVVQYSKNLRSHLSGVSVSAVTRSTISAAACAVVGCDITVQNYQASAVANETAICM